MPIEKILPFSHPQQIADNLFVVYGCININKLLRFSRNMAIVRSGDELTLINAVKMDDAGLAALERLGTIKHVLRLGPFHGMDDGFYVERYGAEFWAPPGGRTYTTPAINHVLEEGGPLPFADAELFLFRHMKEPEGALLLKRTSNVLLTVDSIQSYSTAPHKPHTNLFGKALTPLIGFPNKTLIGPIWMKMAVTDRDGMKGEFRRLLQFDFDQLLSAHGTFCPANAKAKVAAAFEKTFAERP